MNYIIQYVDGEGVFKPTLQEEINGRDLCEVIFDLYTKLYVQDFQLTEFKRKWHAVVVGGNVNAVHTEQGKPCEAINFSFTIHREKQFNQWAVINENKLFFIYPDRELWVKAHTTQLYQTRGNRVAT